MLRRLKSVMQEDAVNPHENVVGEVIQIHCVMFLVFQYKRPYWIVMTPPSHKGGHGVTGHLDMLQCFNTPHRNEQRLVVLSG